MNAIVKEYISVEDHRQKKPYNRATQFVSGTPDGASSNQVIHVNRVSQRQKRRTQPGQIDISHTEEYVTLIDHREIQNQREISIPKQNAPRTTKPPNQTNKISSAQNLHLDTFRSAAMAVPLDAKAMQHLFSHIA
ncbi:hypothetical protein T10_4961 [Trichinella papuae]|uniref:Uncharacterized protein n=1 Tax=Trichinella papuae TaxID=268474 RepID=A0A0V1M2U9_9BILA|nr:hypothetical protein T10_4961 [Trichinella papuae]